jgi:hypothetical protein
MNKNEIFDLNEKEIYRKNCIVDKNQTLKNYQSSKENKKEEKMKNNKFPPPIFSNKTKEYKTESNVYFI